MLDISGKEEKEEEKLFPRPAMQKGRRAKEGGICADQITQIKNKQRG